MRIAAARGMATRATGSLTCQNRGFSSVFALTWGAGKQGTAFDQRKNYEGSTLRRRTQQHANNIGIEGALPATLQRSRG
jgi:hypothetical protein